LETWRRAVQQPKTASLYYPAEKCSARDQDAESVQKCGERKTEHAGHGTIAEPMPASGDTGHAEEKTMQPHARKNRTGTAQTE
jgi:hypothetical protein